MLTYIAGKLQKTNAAGKLPTTGKQSPSPDAVKELFEKIDAEKKLSARTTDEGVRVTGARKEAARKAKT
eukprot:1456843-Karenia_brevis.AAC.1